MLVFHELLALQGLLLLVAYSQFFLLLGASSGTVLTDSVYLGFSFRRFIRDTYLSFRYWNILCPPHPYVEFLKLHHHQGISIQYNDIQQFELPSLLGAFKGLLISRACILERLISPIVVTKNKLLTFFFL